MRRQKPIHYWLLLTFVTVIGVLVGAFIGGPVGRKAALTKASRAAEKKLHAEILDSLEKEDAILQEEVTSATPSSGISEKVLKKLIQNESKALALARELQKKESEMEK